MNKPVAECQKLKMVGYTSMALNPSNSCNLEQLVLKGFIVLVMAKLPCDMDLFVCLFVCLLLKIVHEVHENNASYPLCK